MAQSEDTELRDLVIEALEKNGSLAKIRALLRANIFLAFEDECDNIKHNVNLESVLKIPEGLISLSIIHEFLEYCSLKNTLFVYMSESRQGTEYNYEGKKTLSEKIGFTKWDNIKEPLLVTLIKKNLYQNTLSEQRDGTEYKKYEKARNINSKNDQNCTYIVHEDSNSTSTSQSDNSSDEKNKLQLRLQLDNSDTDTSSDSTRDKSSSEYIPGEHIITSDRNNGNTNSIYLSQNISAKMNKDDNYNAYQKQGENIMPYLMHELKITNNSSSDSTSYIELKPYNSMDEKLINTTGIPFKEKDEVDASTPVHSAHNVRVNNQESKIDSSILIGKSNDESLSSKKEHKVTSSEKLSQQDSDKSETIEYSLDFSSSPKKKDNVDKQVNSPGSIQEKIKLQDTKNVPLQSDHEINSQSSVSISDITNLITEKSSPHLLTNDEKSRSKSDKSASPNRRRNSAYQSVSDNSGDLTESPVPSLSNLSLDIHSD